MGGGVTIQQVNEIQNSQFSAIQRTIVIQCRCFVPTQISAKKAKISLKKLQENCRKIFINTTTGFTFMYILNELSYTKPQYLLLVWCNVEMKIFENKKQL